MIKNNPFLPRLLGYLGLLPIIAPTLLLFLDSGHSAIWSHFLITYAAIILSFIGALHWAFAMTINKLSEMDRKLTFIWSVIPSIIAWISLSMNDYFALLLLAIFFILNLIKDKRLAKSVDLPDWYLPLRSNLTYAVTTCLTIAAIHSKIL